MSQKNCPDCKQLLPSTEFHSDIRRGDGLAFYCKSCAARRSEKSRRARGISQRKVPPIDVAVGSKWCPDCKRARPLGEFPRNRSTDSGYAPYCKPCHNVRGRLSKEKVGGTRSYHLKRRYGITAADADVMLTEQGGLCAICRVSPAVHVDHDHATGKVRGLLCFNCNGGLGQFKDRVDLVEAAAAYLRTHSANDEVVPATPASSSQRWPRVIETYPYRGAGIDVERWRHPIGA